MLQHQNLHDHEMCPTELVNRVLAAAENRLLVALYEDIRPARPGLSFESFRCEYGSLAAAVARGGYLVIGLYLPPPDPTAAALAALRLIRSGGHVWDSAVMAIELRSRGFIEVETCAGPPGVTFMLGRLA